MTDLEIIKKIATLSFLSIREENGLTIIEKRDGLRDHFFWTSNEDFDAFIQDLSQWNYNRGYDAATY